MPELGYMLLGRRSIFRPSHLILSSIKFLNCVIDKLTSQQELNSQTQIDQPLVFIGSFNSPTRTLSARN